MKINKPQIGKTGGSIYLIPTIKVWRNDFREIKEMNFISYGIAIEFLNRWVGFYINTK